MHDNGRRLGLGHHVVVDNVEILDGLVFGGVVESFPVGREGIAVSKCQANTWSDLDLPLNPGHVKDVTLANDLVQTGILRPLNASLGGFLLDVVRHSQRRWRNEVERNLVKRQQLDQAVDSSTILQVTN